VGVQIPRVPCGLSQDPCGMRERTTHARDGGARAVHGAPTAEPASTSAAFQMRKQANTLSVQVVRGVGLPRAVLLRDDLI
jgi:hypothetical protein